MNSIKWKVCLYPKGYYQENEKIAALFTTIKTWKQPK